MKYPAKASARNTSGKRKESPGEDYGTDEERREIAYLERKLGIKDGKGAKSADDGLDGDLNFMFLLMLDLLDGILEPSSKGKKRENKFDDGTSAPKFLIAESEEDEESSEEELTGESDGSEGSDIDISDEESEFKGFSDSTEFEETAAEQPAGRYTPPAACKPQVHLPNHEEDPRLRKQIQGLLNR